MTGGLAERRGSIVTRLLCENRTVTRYPRILSFVSLFPNLGNYTSFWGVDELLGPAYWPRRRIDCRDYRAINVEQYDVAVIGGAGLLAAGFAGFWDWLARQRIPVIIMGVGVCLPDQDSAAAAWERGGVPREAVAALGDRLLYASVRDDLTREYYGLRGADVTYCPTLAFLHRRFDVPVRGRNTLYAHHDGLAHDKEGASLRALADDTTDNLMLSQSGDAILAKYVAADVVITTRLHGAIIAMGLGRPYVAVAHDSKLRAFHRQHGGGILVEGAGDVPGALEDARGLQPQADLAGLARSADRIRAVLAGLQHAA